MDRVTATDGSQGTPPRKKAAGTPSPHFADRLRAAREAAGLTQAEAASRAGVSRPAWNRYERGRQSPGVEQARRLAEAVGASLVELV